MDLTSHPRRGRSRLQTLVAGILALGGGAAILYAGLLPIPPFSSVPVPLAWQVLGVTGLVAAVGVFRGQAWGRALGVSVVAIDLALLVLRAVASSPLDISLNTIFSGVLDVFVLWVLLRRWSARP